MATIPYSSSTNACITHVLVNVLQRDRSSDGKAVIGEWRPFVQYYFFGKPPHVSWAAAEWRRHALAPSMAP